MDADPSTPRRFVSISTGTFARAVCVGVAVWLWLHLWSWMLVALIGVALAIAVEPAVRWLDRRGIRRWYAAPVLVLGGAVLLVAFFVAAGAALRQDATLLESRLRQFYTETVSGLPPGTEDAVRSMAPTPDSIFAAGQAVFGALGALAVALVLTVYFLLDGRRTYDWLLAFAPPEHRDKVRQTAEGACAAIAAYARGNMITSLIAGSATWVVLTILHVPAALLLGVLAFFCDFVPVVGFFLSAGPAVLLAFMVSPTVAAVVLAYFVAYHAAENYYIGPKVYGGALRLSDLAVIAAFLVGAELGGVLGALLALPIAATYPVIERVWLRGTDRGDLPRAHQRIEAQPEH
jgi:predicted PurR-regulated permease PerM